MTKSRHINTPRATRDAFLRKVSAYTDSDCLLWPFGRDGRGYGRAGRTSAHRLVCEMAHGAPPIGQYDAAHSCGNRLCCNPQHLRWATRAENEGDKLLHERHTRGARNGFAKLTTEAVQAIRSAPPRSGRKLAAQYGVSEQTICDIRKNRSWTWL